MSCCFDTRPTVYNVTPITSAPGSAIVRTVVATSSRNRFSCVLLTCSRSANFSSTGRKATVPARKPPANTASRQVNSGTVGGGAGVVCARTGKPRQTEANSRTSVRVRECAIMPCRASTPHALPARGRLVR